MEYNEFLEKKKQYHKPCGFEAENLNSNLFDWQGVVVRWALYKGRAAIFEDTGLGKTIQLL